MASDVKPIITSSGIASMAESVSPELKLNLTKVGLSPISFNANENSVMPENQRFYEIADSKWADGNRLCLSISVEDDDGFDVGSIGLYAKNHANGPDILFAILSKEGFLITQKLPHDQLLISFDLIVTKDISEKINVIGPGERLNLSVASEFATLTKMILELQRQRLEDRDIINNLKERLSRLDGGGIR